MSKRLDNLGRINRSKDIQFTFNGKQFKGFAGDTLASALLANDVKMVARSWKYHRPRGILGSGVEEPNALVQLFSGNKTIPNARMTEVELVDGLTAVSVNANPSIEFDFGALNSWISRFIPAGFYYKTFMASQSAWHFFEKHIRNASGLGKSPTQPDPDRYDKQYSYCDVLIVGGGIAGLTAAINAGLTGARVILCDEQSEFGGWILSSDEKIDGLLASDWIKNAIHKLKSMPNVQLLSRTTAFGFQDHRYLTLAEKRADHLPVELQPNIRERLWRVRAKEVILATGAHERPFVFSNNDLPGIMLASAISVYLRRYGVMLGRKLVVFVNNDEGYDAAIAYKKAGAEVTIVDVRSDLQGSLPSAAKKLGINIISSSVIVEAKGKRCVKKVVIKGINSKGMLSPDSKELECDLVGLSSGFSPVIHLQCQAGSKPKWDDVIQAFVPVPSFQGERSIGAAAGLFGLAECARSGAIEGCNAAKASGFDAKSSVIPNVVEQQFGEIKPLWLVPHPKGSARAPKQFVDLQNDVAASDLLLAVREGFESIEHVKRYTAMGFGTDQGKTGNINGMGIVAQALGKTIPQTGTTTFRPNYTPVTFGLLAGCELGEAFEPVRTTAMHEWHVKQGALFEDVGQWKRPWYYPKPGEDIHSAVHREVLSSRDGVGMLDASTLGKIDIQGPDAAAFLNLIYSNAWLKLEIGKCRYGLMLDENGMVFDDGVTVRLGENHFLMHTTTGGAARVLAWMERWLQTEWPHLKVYLTSVTDHWATTAVIGRHSRKVLKKLCSDINFDDDAFPFMSYREGTIAGVPARVMRISFSGERSYEVNVCSKDGLPVWEAIYEAAKPYGVTPYGTETMHVLRAEKGYIIIGQDTDGSVSPVDLGMSGLVAKTKDFLGKRSLSRSDTERTDRKQLVGLLTKDQKTVLPEGSQILAGNPMHRPTPMQGHVTSSYFSPTLGKPIAMALVKGGLSRYGEIVSVSVAEGRYVEAEIVSPVFFDPTSERQNAE